MVLLLLRLLLLWMLLHQRGSEITTASFMLGEHVRCKLTRQVRFLLLLLLGHTRLVAWLHRSD